MPNDPSLRFLWLLTNPSGLERNHAVMVPAQQHTWKKEFLDVTSSPTTFSSSDLLPSLPTSNIFILPTFPSSHTIAMIRSAHSRQVFEIWIASRQALKHIIVTKFLTIFCAM